jgi:hypothetical protein
MLKSETRKETNLIFCEVMAVPLVSCGSGTWMLKKRDHNRIQMAEIKYIGTIKGFTRTGQLRNENVLNLLDIFPLYKTVTEYGNK